MGVVTKRTARWDVARSTTKGGISLVVAPVSLAVMVLKKALRSARRARSTAAAASRSLAASRRDFACLLFLEEDESLFAVSDLATWVTTGGGDDCDLPRLRDKRVCRLGGLV